MLTDGRLQFTLPDVLRVPLVFHHGDGNEIIAKCGLLAPVAFFP